MRSVLWLIALAGCAESTADNFAKPPPTSGLTVELAAVTLGDDCAPVLPPSSTKPAMPADVEPVPPGEAPATPAKRAPGFRAHCDQTSMQLKIKTPADFKAGSVKIKRVELLDTEGKLLETLKARNPRAWKAASTYVAWDEKLGAGQDISTMYDLNMPNWNKLTNGRWNAHSKSFQVRVVVEINGSNKTVTKQSITATRLPPAVPT